MSYTHLDNIEVELLNARGRHGLAEVQLMRGFTNVLMFSEVCQDPSMNPG
jgi:hypothetical protein